MTRWVIIFTLISPLLLASCTGQPITRLDRVSTKPRPGIVFTSDRTGNWDLFSIQADGSQLTQLTDDPAVDADPDWSPDGSLIAFRSRRDGSSDIFVMGSDGSMPINLINDPQTSLDDEFAPHWHPNGKDFSLYTDRFPPRGSCLSGYHQISLLIQEAEIYGFEFIDTLAGEQYYSTWSPDGRYLVFNSTCRLPGFQLYIYDTQTQETRQITDDPASHSYPAWSHDGSLLAFSKNVDGDNNIFILDMGKYQQSQVTHHPASDSMPSWSPDDSQLAFVTNRDGNKEIYIINVDGSNVYNLTDHPADDWYPTWSPISPNP